MDALPIITTLLFGVGFDIHDIKAGAAVNKYADDVIDGSPLV